MLARGEVRQRRTEHLRDYLFRGRERESGGGWLDVCLVVVLHSIGGRVSCDRALADTHGANRKPLCLCVAAITSRCVIKL